MISTMLKITSGEVRVNDYDASKEPEKVRREIGILFGGDIGLYDRLTGRENIRYFANLFGIKNDEANKRIDELSKDFGMEDYIDKKVGKFSRGMKQKVSISRSIVHNPSVMLFDEPSHSMAEVEKLCDRVIIIHKGKLVEQGRINELKEKYNTEDLEEVFVSLIGGDKDE